jgi:osmotically-inducible protein OsmY
MKRLTMITGILIMVATLGFSQDRLEDADIADAISNEYMFDHAINNNMVNVNVVDGIAELTGTVNNLKAKERAATIAELVKGVRSVSNRIDVEPSVLISDKGIEERILYSLLKDPATDSYEIDVEVTGQIATLTGAVESYQEKMLCGNVAKSVKGVRDLINNITIDYTSDRKDYEIESEIEQALKWNALIDDGLIDVSVNDGEVELSGTVGSASEKSNAYQTAWVTGVRAVDNSGLEVKWWAEDANLRKNKHVYKSDDEIEEAINDAMLYDPRVLSMNITPEAEDGWVTLRGATDNLKAKMAAEKLAEHTAGVTGVTNRIKVKSLMAPMDEEIEANIEDAIWNNAITESEEIVVIVNNGAVTLTGTVDSYQEKLEAEWISSGVEGVNEINNTLDVHYPYSYYWWGYYPYYNLYMTPADPSDNPTVHYAGDAEIKADIGSEIWWNPYVDRDQVDITVAGGHVTLEGTVDSWREFHEAGQEAWEGGAWSVTNNLKIK